MNDDYVLGSRDYIAWMPHKDPLASLKKDEKKDQKYFLESEDREDDDTLSFDD